MDTESIAAIARLLRVALYNATAKHPADNFSLRKVLYFEGVTSDVVHRLLESALAADRPLVALGAPEIEAALSRCRDVAGIVTDESRQASEQAAALAEIFVIDDVDAFARSCWHIPSEW